jgi:hypothetical protein
MPNSSTNDTTSTAHDRANHLIADEFSNFYFSNACANYVGTD